MGIKKVNKIKKFRKNRLIKIILMLGIICLILSLFKTNNKQIGKLLNVNKAYNSANVWYGMVDTAEDTSSVTMDDILADTNKLNKLLRNDDAVRYLMNSKDLLQEFVNSDTAMMALANNKNAKYMLLTNEDTLNIIVASDKRDLLDTATTLNNIRIVRGSSYMNPNSLDRMLSDNNYYWQAGNIYNQEIIFSLSDKINLYKFAIHSTSLNTKPKNYTLYGSNDSDNWQVIREFSESDDITSPDSTYYFSNATLGFQFFKLEIKDTFGNKESTLRYVEIKGMDIYTDSYPVLLNGITNNPDMMSANIVHDSEAMNKILTNEDSLSYLLKCKNIIVNDFVTYTDSMGQIANHTEALTLLMNNSVWKHKIVESPNRTIIQNVSVTLPNMKDSRNPYDETDIGDVISSSMQENNEDYKAIDDYGTSDYWQPEDSDAEQFIGYSYDTPINLYEFTYVANSQDTVPTKLKVQASNDYSSWTDINTYKIDASSINNNTIDKAIDSNFKYKFWRVSIVSLNNAQHAQCKLLKFYGLSNDYTLDSNKNFKINKTIVSKAANGYKINYSMSTEDNCIKDVYVINTCQDFSNISQDGRKIDFILNADVLTNYCVKVTLQNGEILYDNFNVIDYFYGTYENFEQQEFSSIDITNIKVVNSLGEEVKKESTPEGRDLYIKFDVNALKGATYTVSPSLPYAVNKNMTKTFTITITFNNKQYQVQRNVVVDKYVIATKLSELDVGEYLNYDAGTWTQDDINMLGDYYMPNGIGEGIFKNIDVGKSRNIDIRGSNDNKYCNWRILSKNADGSVNIVSSGAVETFYHMRGYSNDSLNILNHNRNWSMYETDYAVKGTAHCMKYNESFAITGDTKATKDDLRNIGYAYWTPQTSLTNADYVNYTDENGVINLGYSIVGIRIVLTLDSDLVITTGNGTAETPYNIGRFLKPIATTVNTGDFVDYDAGTWTEEDIKKLDTLYDDSDTPAIDTFKGFTVGDSKNKSVDYDTYTNANESGWQVNNVADVITLISAGTTEIGNFNCGYQATTNDVLTSIRDWSMYVNSELADSARAFKNLDYKDGEYIQKIYAIGIPYVSSSVYGNGYGGVRAYAIDQYGNVIQPYNSSNGMKFGVRPLVDLKKNIAVYDGDGTKEHPYKIVYYDFEKGASKWNGSIANDFAGGDGSENNPYIITSAPEFAFFAKSVNNGTDYTGKYVSLENNIDLNNMNWTPIGNSTKYFNGTFEGNKNTVKNINVNLETSDKVGLFGYTVNATVQNLNISKGSIIGRNYVGGLIGFAQNTIVSKCSNSNVTITGNTRVGGIIGTLNSVNTKGTSIDKCYNTATVNGGNDYTGGIVGAAKTNFNTSDAPEGYQYADINISNCYNIGEVKGNNYTGGITGYAYAFRNTLNLTNSYNRGKITGVYFVGGIAGGLCSHDGGGGNHSYGTIDNVYGIGQVIGNSSYGPIIGDMSSIRDCRYVVADISTVKNTYSIESESNSTLSKIYDSIKSQYDIVSTLTNSNRMQYTDEQFKTQNFVTQLNTNKGVNGCNWVESNDYPVLDLNDDLVWDGLAANSFSSGTGTEGDPYIVKLSTELAYLAKSVATGNTYEGKYIKLDNNLNLGNIEWSGIGSIDHPFKGNFDGNNKTITNLKINKSTTDNLGLFGVTTWATIKNVIVNNGSVLGNNRCGAIVGSTLNTNIANCINNNVSVMGTEYVGGIAGAFFSSNSSNVTKIDKCYNKAIIGSGNEKHIGGVIGIVSTNCSITAATVSTCPLTATNIYNLGEVKGATYVGGIIGTFSGYREKATFSNGYNTGAVTGIKFVGGCFGTIQAQDGWGGGSGNTYVSNVYNVGNVSGDSSYDGIVGDVSAFSQYVSDASYVYISNTYSNTNEDNRTIFADAAYSNHYNPTFTNTNIYLDDNDFKTQDFANLLNINKGENDCTWIILSDYPTLDFNNYSYSLSDVNNLKNGAQKDVNNGTAQDFWAYGNSIKNINIEVNKDLSAITTNAVNSNVPWDVSQENNKSILAYLVNIENTENTDNLYDLYIVSNKEIALPKDSSYLFSKFKAAETISGLENLNTVTCNDMSWMFFRDTKLKELSLPDNFNTYTVTDMQGMFDECEELNSFSLGNSFDTTNVTNMYMMFSRLGYYSLKSLSLGDKFNTSNVTNMNSMFAFTGINKMNSFDLGNHFNTGNVTNMAYMFRNFASYIPSFDFGTGFDTSSVTNMEYMFYQFGLSTIPNLTLPDTFDTSNVIDMRYMFNEMAKDRSSFEYLDLGPTFKINGKTDNTFNNIGSSNCLIKCSSEQIEALRSTTGINRGVQVRT